jgi:hypothetical protein
MHTASFNVKQAGALPFGLIYVFLHDYHNKQTALTDWSFF